MRGLIPLLMLALAGCAAAGPAGTDRVGPGYATGGGEWSSGGGISAVVRVFEREGRTTVCGAWATDRQSALTETLNEGVMQAGSVYLAGRRLVQGLGFMRRVAYAPDISGAQANCVASPVPWDPAFATEDPRLRFPRVVVADDMDGGLDGAGAPVFRERVRPAIAG